QQRDRAAPGRGTRGPFVLCETPERFPNRGRETMYRGMTLALLVLFAGTTMASERGTRVDVEQQFAEQRAQILEELGDGETFSEIEAADREKVKAALARISTTLTQSGGIAGLNEQEKLDVFN